MYWLSVQLIKGHPPINIAAGCFCPRDKLLLEEDGETKCVDRDECPSVGGEECPEGKVYRQCGTACPLTCENKDDDVIPCTLQCVPGKKPMTS